MKVNFENPEALARLNFLIDLASDLFDDEPEIKCWDDLPKDEKDIYLEEATENKYTVLVEDVINLEKIVKG
jgi:hypothetical protein